MAELSGLTGLRRLELSDTEINDAGLANLRSLKNLQYLNVSFCGLKGTGLASLAGLKDLRRLDLSSDHLDATVYERIAGFSDLEILVLSRCGLKDAALQEFSKLKGLRELIISSNSDVTDSGIKHLLACRQLRRLDVCNTGVSTAGLVALKALPLEWLRVDEGLCAAANLAVLKKAFPKAQIVPPKVKRGLSPELFAPLR